MAAHAHAAHAAAPSARGLVARLALRNARRGALIWGLVFGLTVAVTVLAYESTFGTPVERTALLRGIGANAGFRAMFGQAREIDTVAGFTAWRTMGFLPLIAGVWGLLVATRLLRGEEDSGRWELLLTGPLTRAGATLATLSGIVAATLALFLPTAVGLLLAGVLPGDLPLGGSLWLALALSAAAPAFAVVGAVMAQLAPTRREAAALAGFAFVVLFTLRVAADGAESLGWLRWCTPLGWIEEMRPLTGARPLALLPLLAWTIGLGALAVWLAGRRDAGSAPLARRDEHPPHRLLLRSHSTLALRESLGGLLGWSLALGFTGLLYGLLAKSVADLARDSAGLREHVSREVGEQVDILSTDGYIAVVFVFIAVVLALYAATHATAARTEESSGRLETLLAQPLGRREWIVGRLAMGAACCVVVALVTALAAWVGVVVRGSELSLFDMLKTALNMLPVVALFLGVAFLGLAFVPRHTGAIAFGAIGGAYLWEQTGALVQAPGWTLAISPFHWLALVPARPIDVVASLTMLAVGAACATIAVARFRARDLVSA